MKDPTRIPAVIATLQQVWEAQPDRTLAQLWGTLENRGLGWATSDTELVDLLSSELGVHPLELRQGQLREHYAVADTESPRRRVTLDPVGGRVTVRSYGDGVRATSWCGGRIVKLAVGVPLVIRDQSGVDHRLGVVREITRLERQRGIDISGLRRRDIGDGVYGITVARRAGDGWDLVTVSHSIEVNRVGLREVTADRLRYEEVAVARSGEEMVVLQQGGGRMSLGVVGEIFPLEGTGEADGHAC